jgi:hypothetical protein
VRTLPADQEQERRSGASREGGVVSWIGILGLIAAAALAGVLLRGARRSRASIQAMLDDSRPCAVRIRR